MLSGFAQSRLQLLHRSTPGTVTRAQRDGAARRIRTKYDLTPSRAQHRAANEFTTESILNPITFTRDIHLIYLDGTDILIRYGIVSL